jgi:hypothetical protein
VETFEAASRSVRRYVWPVLSQNLNPEVLMVKAAEDW